jgi:GNAT superfamily N-acetyltransferase
LNVEPRISTPADIPAITSLINRAYVVERFFKVGDRTDEEGVRGLQAKGTFLVLEREDAPIGCVYVELRGARGYIGLLSVDPDRQGTGAGRVLMAAAEAYCLAHGARDVDLRVVNLREELPPFYQRFGYVECGTEPFSDPEEATRPCHFIVMTKSLVAPRDAG